MEWVMSRLKVAWSLHHVMSQVLEIRVHDLVKRHGCLSGLGPRQSAKFVKHWKLTLGANDKLPKPHEFLTHPHCRFLSKLFVGPKLLTSNHFPSLACGIWTRCHAWTWCHGRNVNMGEEMVKKGLNMALICSASP